jgi:hypothetical protein
MTSIFSLTLLASLATNSPAFTTVKHPESNDYTCRQSDPKNYISNWETAINWQRKGIEKKIAFYAKHDFSQIAGNNIQNEVVIVFAKGYHFQEFAIS